jgi:hypothetical protein
MLAAREEYRQAIESGDARAADLAQTRIAFLPR